MKLKTSFVTYTIYVYNIYLLQEFKLFTEIYETMAGFYL